MTTEKLSPTFHTPLGKIIGYIDGTVVRATGIPYAAAGRFEIPQPVAHEGILYATRRAPACPQTQNRTLVKMLGFDLHEEMEISEDCLNLSITRPNNLSENLPVMVWVHGGSYIMGAGDAAYTDPKKLVSEQQVIVVTLTYRLGIFGFLGGYKEIPANLGYLDLWEALRWVKKHIRCFGGDSGNICLFGQSAGGDAIAQLMLIEGTRDLFHKVIIQSAPLGIIRNKHKMISRMQKGARKIHKEATTQELIKKQNAIIRSGIRYGFKGGMPFGAHYGKYPFPEERDIDKIWEERAAAIPVLIGSTSEETGFFLAFSSFAKGFLQMPGLGKWIKERTVRATTDKIYRKGAAQFAYNARMGAQMYRYEIFWNAGANFYGAMHCIDLPLLFWQSSKWSQTKLLKGIKASEIEEKGRQVRGLWARFAREGKLSQSGSIEGVLHYALE